MNFLDRYILDFFCPSANLAIELDGETHYTPEAIEYDRIRDNYLQSVGINVIRYPNHEIYENLEEMLEDIRGYLFTTGSDRTKYVSKADRLL